jgi:hypothetical protein
MSCQDIKTKLDNLKEARLEVIASLHRETDPAVRADLVREFKNVSMAMSFNQRKYDRCLEEEDGLTPLMTRFIGTYGLTIAHPDAAGLHEGDVEIGVLFNASRTEVDITSFPELAMPRDDEVTTISKIGGGNGTFDKPSGRLALGLVLKFDHSEFFVSDSTLSFTLSTANVGGSPLNSTTRALTLAAKGTFNGGHLGGSQAELQVAGKLGTLP